MRGSLASHLNGSRDQGLVDILNSALDELEAVDALIVQANSDSVASLRWLEVIGRIRDCRYFFERLEPWDVAAASGASEGDDSLRQFYLAEIRERLRKQPDLLQYHSTFATATVTTPNHTTARERLNELVAFARTRGVWVNA